MKVSISWRRDKPDTANGEKLIVTQVYSSWNQSEIDAMEKTLQLQCGSGMVAVYEEVKEEKYNGKCK